MVKPITEGHDVKVTWGCYKLIFILAVTLSTLALNAGVLISTVSVSGFVALQENRSQVLTALPSPPLPTPVRIKPLAELL